MKTFLYTILVAISILVSCKKETSNPGNNTAKYMSLTANSSWVYESTDNILNDSLRYTVTSTSMDSTINNRIYHVFTNTSGANQYYNISGNNYYTFQNLPLSLGNGSVENIYLEDNVAAGGTWSQPYTINVSGYPLTVNLINTVTEKGITKIVNGITYTDVIHITTTLSVSLLGLPLPADAIATNIEAFYARKVGMIQSKNKISVNYAGNVTNIDTNTYLVQSDIK